MRVYRRLFHVPWGSNVSPQGTCEPAAFLFLRGSPADILSKVRPGPARHWGYTYTMLPLLWQAPAPIASPLVKEALAFVQRLGDEVRMELQVGYSKPDLVRAHLAQSLTLQKACKAVAEEQHPVHALLEGTSAALQAHLGHSDAARSYAQARRTLQAGLKMAATSEAKGHFLEALSALAAVGGQPDLGWKDESLALQVKVGRLPQAELEMRLVMGVRDAFGEFLEPPDHGALRLRATLLAEVWLRRMDAVARTRAVLEQGCVTHADAVWHLAAKDSDDALVNLLRQVIEGLDGATCIEHLHAVGVLVRGLLRTPLEPEVLRLVARMDRAAQIRWKDQPAVGWERRLAVASLTRDMQRRLDCLSACIDAGVVGLDALVRREGQDLVLIKGRTQASLRARLLEAIGDEAHYAVLRDVLNGPEEPPTPEGLVKDRARELQRVEALQKPDVEILAKAAIGLAAALDDVGRADEADAVEERIAERLERGDQEQLPYALQLRSSMVTRGLNAVPTRILVRRLEAAYALMVRLTQEQFSEGTGVETLVPMLTWLDREGRHGEILRRLDQLEHAYERIAGKSRPDTGPSALAKLRAIFAWRAALN